MCAHARVCVLSVKRHTQIYGKLSLQNVRFLVVKWSSSCCSRLTVHSVTHSFRHSLPLFPVLTPLWIWVPRNIANQEEKKEGEGVIGDADGDVCVCV